MFVGEILTKYSNIVTVTNDYAVACNYKYCTKVVKSDSFETSAISRSGLLIV